MYQNPMNQKMNKKKFLPVIVSLFASAPLAGCGLFASQEGSGNTFDSVVIQNRAVGPVHAVELVIPGVADKLSCEAMAPGDTCNLSVAPMAHPADAFTLNWKYAGESDRTIPLPIQQRAGFDPDASNTAVIEIQAGGIFAAYWSSQ